MRLRIPCLSKAIRSPRLIRRYRPLRKYLKNANKLSKALQGEISEELPNELLTKILFHCDEATLRTARRTCRRWHSVINETLGISVAIGKSYMTTLRKPPVHFQPIEIIENVGIKYCYVGDLTNVQGCPFGYPETVRNMIFDGPITKFNLITLLSSLPALTHLTMHYASLENIKFKRALLCTASLKSLKITSHGVGEEYDRSRAVSLLKNLISLLMIISSKQLEVMTLDVIHIPFYDKKVTTAVFDVLLRHKHTLKNIQFYNISERLEPAPPGTESDRQSNVSRQNAIISQALQEAVHLKRISYGAKRNMESEKAWNQLIQNQQSIEELFYMNDNRDIHSSCIPCLLKNAATLQKTLFHISGVDETRNITVFDCKILKNFLNLTHLLVRGRKIVFSIANVDNDIPARITKVPVLMNIDYIPNTVTIFSMRDICLKTSDLSKLIDTKMLPNIIKIRFIECGSLDEYGINPETLLELLKRQNLKELEIIKSFCLMAWERAVGQDIYEDALFYRVKTEWEFHAQRDSVSGVFCTKDEPMFNYGRYETSLRADDVCDVVFQ